MERREGLSKLGGRELFVDDVPVDGCLWGMTVRSPSPRGRIRGVRFGNAVDRGELVTVDHRDVPGPNEVLLIERDQPILAAERVRHLHEPVLLIAHESRRLARRVRSEIEIDVDPETPVLDFRRPPEPDQIQYGDDNIFKKLRIDKGDVDAALASAPFVIEGVYETGAQEHVYIETQGILSWLEDDVLVVKGSMQCPYYVLKALTHALGRPEDRVRVIQAPTGGGFGGKEEYPSHVALHAALLALQAQRPVKIVYDRNEDMVATTKRHPAWIRHRTGVDRDGRLLAQDIEVVLDGGAYVTLSPVVLSRGILHATGPYHCDNVRVRGRVVFTNAVPFGAFRGFGAPQTQFANERHLDVIARRLGIEPTEIRRRNLLRDGQSTATGQIVHDGTNREAILDEALELSSYRAKTKAHRAFNRSHPYLRRGLGVATFHHGAGFTGSGEVMLQSEVHVAGEASGTIELLTANIEMGQGTLTVFTKIAAERLGLEPDEIRIAEADTFRVPNSGPTVASRTAMIVGRLVERACDDLRSRLGLGPDARGERVREALRQWHAANREGSLRGRARYQKPDHVAWDEATYTGDAYGAYAWATYVAEVEVDLRSWQVAVIDFVAVQEVGRVLDETLARGQIQGGVVQGIGWALYEECHWAQGGMANPQLTNYIIPTSDDVPAIRVAFLETPYEHGAQGAKGLGELPIDGPAPAVVNAVAAATGADPRSIPLTPERLMQVLEKARR